MNELVTAQRKAIQMELDKLKTEKNPIKIYMIDEEVRDMESELSKMLNPKIKKI